MPKAILAQTSSTGVNLTDSSEPLTSGKPLTDKNTDNLKQWKYLAGTGDREAQFRLGLYYHSLGPVLDNPQQSIYWYEAAAKQGHTLAQYNLGVKLIMGQGIEKNPEKALALWLQSANSGHIQSQFNVGRAYFLGIGLVENQQKARFWFEKAAQQGDPKAKNLLLQLGSSDSALNQKLPTQEAGTEEKSLNQHQLDKNPSPADDSLISQSSNTNSVTKVNQSQSIAVYTGPNSHNHFMMQLPNRVGLSIVDTRGHNWLKVSKSSGLPVWVHQDFVKADNQNLKGIITTKAVRARGLPEIVIGSTLGFFNKGESVTILEHRGSWYRVLASTNYSAWVKRQDWEQNKK